jgi:hypothetical protein
MIFTSSPENFLHRGLAAMPGGPYEDCHIGI